MTIMSVNLSGGLFDYSMISSAIQQKFMKLLDEISQFMSGERQLLDKDHDQLSLARTSALELAQESSSSNFDRFLTYLFGTTEINSDYPLQAVRMMCLTAKALQAEQMSADQRQEVLTAALLADTGFRPAWLGHHGSHYEITAYQLKGLTLPWFTPGLERLIMNHHSPENDTSPSRILSLIARYLGMVYGTGVEDIGQSLISPAKTMETLMAELHPETSGMRLLLKALSAFPLGSWVQMSSGEAGLVTGTSAKNPLRPKVSLYRNPPKNGSYWEEIDLEKKPTIHLTGEISPTDTQTSLLNFPEILVPGWLRGAGESGETRQPPAADLIHANEAPAPAANVLPSNLKNADDYRRFVMQKNRQSIPATPPESAPGLPNPTGWKADDLASGSFGSKHRLLKFYREELVKLRMTWEQQVHAAEQVSSSLKSPLIESYRRENELMSVMIERLEAIGADVSREEPVAEIPEPDSSPAVEAVSEENIAVEDASIKLSENPASGLREVQDHLNRFREHVDQDQESLRALKEKLRNTLQHLESRDFKTLPSLMAFVRQWQSKLQPMGEQLATAEQQMNALMTEWGALQATVKSLASTISKNPSGSWKDELKRRMEQVLTALQKTLETQHHRLKVNEEMIDRFCAQAQQLAV